MSSRLADTDATRPEEGEAHVAEDVLRGARVEKALVESRVESEEVPGRAVERCKCSRGARGREVHVVERCTLSRRTCSRGARPELGAVVLGST